MSKLIIKSSEVRRSERKLTQRLTILCNKGTENDLAKLGPSSCEVDQVAVRLKFSYSKDCNVLVRGSFKILDLKKNDDVQITVTCRIGDVVKHHVCSREWSNYMDLSIAYTIDLDDYTFYFASVYIRVNLMEPRPCRFMYKDDTFFDFRLSTEDSSVPVHRVVMAAHSEVFKIMLNGEWKETAKGCLEVKGVTQQTLQHLKDYMYLGSLPEHDDLRPLLLIAKCYMMRNLEEACTDKLVLTMKPEQLLDLHNFATDNHLSELIFSMLQLTSNAVIDSARKAITQKSKLEDNK